MPSVLGVAGIDDAVFLHLGEGIGQELVGHLRVLLLDQRVGRLVVAVEIVGPADDRGVDEALHQVGPFLHEIAPRFDQGRVAVEALVGDQEHLGLEMGLLLDRIGLGGDVALHGAALVGEERLRVGGVGLHLRLAEAEVGLEVLEVAGEPFARDEQGELLEVLELVDALVRVRHQHLRLLLEHGGDRERRDVLLDRVEALQRVRRHKEVELADRQQDAVVHVRPARHDGDVEAVALVGAVDQRLVMAAVLALRHPVGAERHLVERLLRLRGGRAQHARDGEDDDDGDAVQCFSTHSHLTDGYRRHNRCPRVAFPRTGKGWRSKPSTIRRQVPNLGCAINNSTAVVGGATSFRMDSEKSCRCRPPILAPKTVELKQGGLLLGSERSPHKQLLFNLILNGPKPLFGADGSVSPVLNLSHHLMCSIFGCSEFHGKLVCQTHSAIAVFFRQASRRSDLRNDGLPRIV